jgi:tetraacyldisaccharide 4'-kinase
VSFVARHWSRLTWLCLLLLPVSLLFRLAVVIRRLLYRIGALASVHLPVPVLVVGNVTVGGTGKTPLVLWLADFLVDCGYRPGIIARGYGGSERLQEVTAHSEPAQAGDEAVLLARRSHAPVFVCRDRVAAGKGLLEAHPDCDVIISDDGLQHYRLARDLEIAVVDGERGLGNGLLLPAGPLREPPRRLNAVNAIVFNGKAVAGLRAGFVMRLESTVFMNVLNPAVTTVCGRLRGQRLHAVAGIGNPERFFQTLSRMGLAFQAHPFPDHHAFRSTDLDFRDADAILMTEKDAVKCQAFARESFWYLPVEAKVDPALGELILERLNRRHGPQAA